ncbi:hypothetical protein PHYPSEUDO_008057 [Phytophthora pseudosyringae]|uniref:Uncharacterized protein n=1 Tax=Phytophthora pseudosyringae TaxID=221518 RepID=A0A8T1VI57_9STRA|nr:hypothetical protein PHYPSEUDO_008057 [Phytophthora pseudosyringae]
MVKRKPNLDWAVASKSNKRSSGEGGSRQTFHGVREGGTTTEPSTGLSIRKAAARITDARTIQPAASSTTPVLSKAEVKEACAALRLKQRRDKQGRRKYGRLLASEPHRLSDSQKIMFANSYKTARNAEEPVDHVRMSKSCHFSSFKGHPHLLAAMGSDVVVELKEALVEQSEIQAGRHVKTTTEWEEEFASVQVLHKKHVATMEKQLEKLEKELADTKQYTADLRARFVCVEKENQRLKKIPRPCISENSDGATSQQNSGVCEQQLNMLRGSLRKQQAALKRKDTDMAALSISFSILGMRLAEEQAALRKQPYDQDNERHRLDTQTALTERMKCR